MSPIDFLRESSKLRHRYACAQPVRRFEMGWSFFETRIVRVAHSGFFLSIHSLERDVEWRFILKTLGEV